MKFVDFDQYWRNKPFVFSGEAGFCVFLVFFSQKPSVLIAVIGMAYMDAPLDDVCERFNWMVY
ncbi:hypothetical protein I6F65_04825 [Pseudoalteromonas sp. SWXJZ94C]|uniref:hypothetical protein n=1 Tax=Pseudoalteromonas sp. SWXJZ94C TaxID=2792065 RepID=UPI0018CE5F08|nr:hypothetical protein [Pseudoalteromonas sp. SWXJZ94C]MBH0056275.1 hypothetical protein [Pseudoalteromonas sp. SWXJZ94C]